MSRRLTTDEFIARSREVHGDRYDYSLVEYVRNHRKVTVICREHGPFDVAPSAHMNGVHCARCQGRQKLTLDVFLSRAHAVHGDTYDYRQIDVTRGLKSKVSVICKKHGEFKISAAWHINGQGCPRCSGRNRDKTTKEFIQDAVEVWSDTYTYDRAEYHGSKTHLIVTCREHGDFKTTPNGLLRGYGCPTCGGSAKQTQEQFVAAARAVHGNKYDYSQAVYINNQTPVVISCDEHGEFLQRPANHKSGQGCPACANNGFNASEPAWFYVVGLYGPNGEYVGFGITRDLEFRLKTHARTLREHGMELEVLHSRLYSRGRDALDTETAVKQLLPTVNIGIDGFRRECVDKVHQETLIGLVE